VLECEAWTLHLPCPPGSIRIYLGLQMLSGIDHIENPTEDGVFKIVNDTPAKAGTIRLMTRWVTSIT
jgi:alpha-amylase